METTGRCVTHFRIRVGVNTELTMQYIKVYANADRLGTPAEVEVDYEALTVKTDPITAYSFFLPYADDEFKPEHVGKPLPPTTQ